MPSSRASSAAACVLALTAIVAAQAELSAHRRDEYLQAARLGIDANAVRLELDLTPGIAMAEAIIADIDRNGDGSLTEDEQRAYADAVVSGLTLQVDGRPIRPLLGVSRFPNLDAIRRGEGTIRLQSTAALPRLALGSHQLLFRNQHHPDRSVYLANALVPASKAVAVTAQRRDGVQRELTIDYVLRAQPGTPIAAWLLGSMAAVSVASVVGFRRFRPATRRPRCAL